jgi:polyisoprenoid-binding protein YceI
VGWRWPQGVILIGAAITSMAILLSIGAAVVLLRPSPEKFRLNTPVVRSPGSGPAQLAGRWSVTGGSEAGYRIREKFARLSAPNEAVGRTRIVTGDMLLEVAPSGDLKVHQARFVVDTTTLTSDERGRDERIHDEFLETRRYPRATFEADSFDVPARAATGSDVQMPVRGRLTIHGKTRVVEIPVQARLRESRIEVVGALGLEMPDYGVEPPNIAEFVVVEPHTTMEVHLFMEKTRT